MDYNTTYTTQHALWYFSCSLFFASLKQTLPSEAAGYKLWPDKSLDSDL